MQQSDNSRFVFERRFLSLTARSFGTDNGDGELVVPLIYRFLFYSPVFLLNIASVPCDRSWIALVVSPVYPSWGKPEEIKELTPDLRGPQRMEIYVGYGQNAPVGTCAACRHQSALLARRCCAHHVGHWASNNAGGLVTKNGDECDDEHCDVGDLPTPMLGL